MAGRLQSGGGAGGGGSARGEARRRRIGGGAARVRVWAAARVGLAALVGFGGSGVAAYKGPPGGVPLGYGPESV